MVMSREEVFRGTGPAAGGTIEVKIGAKKSGRIVAAELVLKYQAGAFAGSPVGPGCMCAFAMYDLDHVHITGYDVVSNRPKVAAYRAPGAPNSSFGVESCIDELARELGIDPLALREMNAARDGTKTPYGPTLTNVGYMQTLEAAKNHPNFKIPLGPNQGRGIASGFWFNIGGESSASVHVNEDGTVAVVEGNPDIGGSRASMAMMAAEVLGIPYEKVRPVVGDTASIGFTFLTGGSRVTFATGWAAYEAAQDIKRQMLDRAAQIWEVKAEDVTYEGGMLQCKKDTKKRFSFKDLAAKLHETGGTIVGRATVDPTGVGGGFATHIVDVEVDPETGKVAVLRYTAVQDVGKAIHPSYVEGQMQGGAAQGIGWALNEEYRYNDKGEMTNASFLDYRMPTCLDLPMIDTVLVEVANPGHPYGVRGVGEVPIVSPPAALANAIYRAVGVRMRELPMSPGRVVNAIHAK
jgi:CO/xanthine dehydrogenase Mo-binding subunit